MHKEKGRKYIIRNMGIITGTILLLMGCIYVSAMIDRSALHIEEEGEPELSMLYVTRVSDEEGARAKEGRVNWWFDKDSGNYFLFLPAAANMGKLRLGLNGISKVAIDGAEVRDEEIFSIQPGKHTITTEADNRKYQVVFMKSAGVNSIFINTESGNMRYIESNKGNEEEGTALFLSDRGEVQYYGEIDFLKGRGNISWDDLKKAYSMKLSKKTDLYGMGSSKKWNLIANYNDRTMLRNYITYDFAKEVGMAFTPDSIFADLYLNGNYCGLYQLCEKVEIDEERINLSNLEKQTENRNPGKELREMPQFGATFGQQYTEPDTAKGYEIENNPSDITGGYLLELDMGYRYLEDDSGFVTSRNQAVVVKSPQYTSRQQINYVWEKYQEFEDAIYSWDGIHPESQKPYYEYMDLNSFAQKYIVEEITKNLDASISSFFIYKYPDQINDKFYAGPVWDYDRAIGNFGIGYNDEDLSNPEELYASQDVTASTIWYAVFFREEFHNAVLDHYYGAFREKVLEQVEGKIDLTADVLVDSVIMNAIRWDTYATNNQEKILVRYKMDLNTMKDFLAKRIAFLDQEWKRD